MTHENKDFFNDKYYYGVVLNGEIILDYQDKLEAIEATKFYYGAIAAYCKREKCGNNVFSKIIHYIDFAEKINLGIA